MALYRMRCTSCGFTQDRRIAATLDPKTFCTLCEQEARPVPPKRGQEIVRTGDDWVGKGMELRAQMARRAARVQQDAPHAPTLRPNVEGEEVGSWAEAARLAASKGLDPRPFTRMAEAQS